MLIIVTTEIFTSMTVHRLVLSPFFHASLLHVAFNMLAFTPDASHIERYKGSVQFGYLLLQLMLCMDVLYIVVAYVSSVYGEGGDVQCAKDPCTTSMTIPHASSIVHTSPSIGLSAVVCSTAVQLVSVVSYSA